MAKAPQKVEGLVKARVLVDCDHGKCGAVIEIEADLAEKSGDYLDTNPDAVAYAESLHSTAAQ